MTSRDTISLWDDEADTFDDAADHGLRDPAVRKAWRTMLAGLLPPAPCRVADLGCGTGTLALLLAEDGYAVDGVDFSPEMVRRAIAKTEEEPAVRITEGDAYDPPLTAAGLTAEQVADAARTVGREPRVLALDDPALWGGPITDERYAIVC